MRTFFAGNTGTIPRERGLLKLVDKRLSSYFFVKDNFFLCGDLFKEVIMNHPAVDLFLDSGAFSAFTQGVTVDIDEYIAFVKKHQKFLTVYANLDVIGDAVATMKNQKYMEAKGLMPLPAFHFGEDFKYLEYYIDNYEYVALGMAGNKNSGVLSAWLDKCFNMICDQPSHLPRVKVHGYAMTSVWLMIRYPWYSVDSTSWVVQSRLGDIMVPRVDKNDELIYNDRIHKIQVSSRSPNLTEKGEHYRTLNPHLKAHVDKYIKAKGYVMGKSEFKVVPEDTELKDNERWFGKAEDGKRTVEQVIEPGLCNDYRKRDEMNVIYFLDLEKHLPDWPWPFQKQEAGFGL